MRQSCDSFCMQKLHMIPFVCIIAIYNILCTVAIGNFCMQYCNWQLSHVLMHWRLLYVTTMLYMRVKLSNIVRFSNNNNINIFTDQLRGYEIRSAAFAAKMLTIYLFYASIMNQKYITHNLQILGTILLNRFFAYFTTVSSRFE